jgi:hypothetical protein
MTTNLSKEASPLPVVTFPVDRAMWASCLVNLDRTCGPEMLPP